MPQYEYNKPASGGGPGQSRLSESSIFDRGLITTQRVLFYTFNSISFKHFCVVILHLYSNWHVKDLAMTSNHNLWLVLVF